MADLWDKIVERFGSASSLQKIKFGRGVVGKLAGIAIVLLICVAYMTRSLPPTQVFLAIVVTVACTLLIVGSIVLIAFARPELAVMEGMELVHWKQLTQASKDYYPGRELPPVPDPSDKPKLQEQSQ